MAEEEQSLAGEEKSSDQDKRFIANINEFRERYNLDPKLFLFGPLVKIYREKFTERWNYHNNISVPKGIALAHISARNVMARLAELEEPYTLKSGTYSSIESSNSLPRNHEAFVKGIKTVLHIEDDSEEDNELLNSLIFSSTLRDSGPLAAWKYLWNIVGLSPEEYPDDDKVKEKFNAYVKKREALLRDGYLPKTSLHPDVLAHGKVKRINLRHLFLL